MFDSIASADAQASRDAAQFEQDMIDFRARLDEEIAELPADSIQREAAIRAHLNRLEETGAPDTSWGFREWQRYNEELKRLQLGTADAAD